MSFITITKGYHGMRDMACRDGQINCIQLRLDCTQWLQESQMIPHNTKHGSWSQNHVSSMLRSWVTPQVRIHFLKLSSTSYSPSTLFLILGWSESSENGPKWFPITQNMAFETRTLSLACTEDELLHSHETRFENRGRMELACQLDDMLTCVFFCVLVYWYTSTDS